MGHVLLGHGTRRVVLPIYASNRTGIGAVEEDMRSHQNRILLNTYQGVGCYTMLHVTCNGSGGGERRREDMSQAGENSE